MSSLYFIDRLKAQDDLFQMKRKRIILLVDKCPAFSKDSKLSLFFTYKCDEQVANEGLGHYKSYQTRLENTTGNLLSEKNERT